MFRHPSLGIVQDSLSLRKVVNVLAGLLLLELLLVLRMLLRGGPDPRAGQQSWEWNGMTTELLAIERTGS